MEKKGLYWKVRGWFIETIAFASPVIAITLQTHRATREDGYHDSPITLKDPGHIRVRMYDRLVLIASYVVGIFIFFFNSTLFNFDPAEWVGASDIEFKIISTVLFPQITGGWFTLLLWSGFFVFLRFYDRMRSRIIRDTNERLKVW